MPFEKRCFYLVRHGQTEANRTARMCGGDWDIDLNDEGRAQANRLASIVPRLLPPPEIVWVSPMARARQTAEALNAEARLELRLLESLREWRVGDWESKPWAEVPNPFETPIDPPGGEPRLDFERRVESAFRAVLADSRVPLVVTHGAVAHALFTVMGIDRLKIENCAIYRVDAEAEAKPPRWKLARVD